MGLTSNMMGCVVVLMESKLTVGHDEQAQDKGSKQLCPVEPHGQEG